MTDRSLRGAIGLLALMFGAISGPALARSSPEVGAASGGPSEGEAPAAEPTPTIADLQRQIDELKAMVEALREGPPPAAGAPQTPAAGPADRRAFAAGVAPEAPEPPDAPAGAPAAASAGASAGARAEARAGAPDLPARALVEEPSAVQRAEASPPITRPPPATPDRRAWYERLVLRGYTQIRVNEIITGDASAPPGQSRLRAIGDGGISDTNNFSFRRVRLILQGDLNDHVSLYIQPDFATAIANQTVGERRENFGQLRDAFADVFLFGGRNWRLRLGQSKVPFGWENLQSSSNRLALDRTDAINSAVPGERDLGVVVYYTPDRVSRIWARLAADQQKLFGNYGAFGAALYNGQGTNRIETNHHLMYVAMATWPFELDGLGLAGQVFEVGGAILRNRFNPELRSGGTSPIAYRDDRVGLHAILYPQPFGVQAEWNWGTGPEFDALTQRIEERPLSGGYVQAMARVRRSPIGSFYPFARWQHYRGGFKGAINAARLETDELEAGVEFVPTRPLELTVSYGWARRREADERRSGQAEGQLVRVQAQWNY